MKRIPEQAVKNHFGSADYLEGVKAGIKNCVIEEHEGLDHHEIEISDFRSMRWNEMFSAKQLQSRIF